MDTKTTPVYLDPSSYPFDFTEQYLYPGASPYTVPLQASPPLAFGQLNLSGSPADFGSYPSNGYSTSSSPPTPGQPQRPFTPVDTIAPHVTTAGIHSGSEDGFISSKHSHSGRSESPKIPGASQLVQRREPARRGSNSSTASRLSLQQASRRRRAARDDDFDSDDDGEYAPEYIDTKPGPGGKGGKKEEVRRQRIESEQRRRDELREGYRKLKDVLPTSNQKASKVSLLDRATTHIRWLELSNQQLQQRVQAAEMETQRLRHVNEKMMIATAEHNQQALAAAAAQVSIGQY